MQIVGVVNITTDSFSDGGRYLQAEQAIAHARQLRADGADIIELGAASSHPDATPVSAVQEIERLAPVFAALLADGITLSVDSFQPDVQLHFAAAGVHWLNDTRGFSEPSVHRELARHATGLVVMHSLDASGMGTRRASPADIMAHVQDFLAARVKQLVGAGVRRERLVIDPGMGFFLGDAPEASLTVLRRFGELHEALGLPVMLSVTRKSVLGTITGRPVAERGAASLAAELACVLRGVNYVRTHDARALADGVRVFRALGLLPGASEEVYDGSVAHTAQ